MNLEIITPDKTVFTDDSIVHHDTVHADERVAAHGAAVQDGAVSHMAIGGLPDLFALAVCAAATLLGARVAALFANRADAKTLNRITGVVLTVLGGAMVLVKYF